MKELVHRTLNPYAAQVANRTIGERVDFLNGALDSLEQVQNQYAAGCILIGMELLALKNELGHGQFTSTFAEKIERPRFGYRTAARFMKVAEVIRVKLASGSSMKLGEALAMALAPSAMTDAERKELLKRVGDATQGKTMQQLMLDFAPQANRPALPEHTEEELDRKTTAYWRMHYNQALSDLCDRLSKIVTAKKFLGALSDDELRQHRQVLEAILSHFPAAKGKKGH
jgi:hypothetical protein